jgi:hypothetical protein
MGNSRALGTCVGLCLSVLVAGCALEKKHDTTEEPLPFELTREECDNLVEIDTQNVRLSGVEGPGKAQQALDAANPAGANLADYTLTFTVEQQFTNLLDRPLTIEAASATFTDPESGDGYETAYELDAPIELDAHEDVTLTFDVVVPADQLSGSYVLGLLTGTVGGMTIAPLLLITVPDSDNCGYPEGMEVLGKEGTVEVRRPVKLDPVLSGILSGILKGVGHG